MKAFIGSPGCGKTSRLIHMAQEEGLIMVVPCQRDVVRVIARAKFMGINMWAAPITFEAFQIRSRRGMATGRFVIDDIERCLGNNDLVAISGRSA